MSNNGPSGRAITTGRRQRSSEAQASDEMLYCERCGISFLWTVEERRQAVPGGDVPVEQAPPRFCPGCRVLLPAAGRERGMVKWYNIRKRYGFIVRHNQPDLFVPAASLQGTRFLQSGDLVEFTIGSNDEGKIATDVRILAHAQP